MQTSQQISRECRWERSPRRGATAVELAVTLMLFVTLVIGVMELSMLVFQTHVVNHVARQVARKAIVHGAMAPEDFSGGPWGPTTYGPAVLSATGADDPIGEVVRDQLLILDPSETTVVIQWTDGDHQVGDRVFVRISSQVDSLAGMFTSESTISAESVMRIAH